MKIFTGLVARNSEGEGSASHEVSATPVTSGTTQYDPIWGSVEPVQTIDYNYDSSQSAAQNGAAVRTAISSLQVGQMLQIAGGIYHIGTNNVAYSETGNSIQFGSGSVGVTVLGNVAFGSVSGVASGYVVGSGLNNFESVSWEATQRDATPVSSSTIAGAADGSYVTSDDLYGNTRTAPYEAGCIDLP